MKEGGEFPGSEVAGEKQNALAASVRALEIFKALIGNDAGRVFAGVAREEADFGELASEGDEFAAQQAAALGRRHFREGESQVAEADAAQASVDEVDDEAESDSLCARQGSGEQAQELYPGPEEGVFEAFAHGGAVPSTQYPDLNPPLGN